MRLWLMFSLLFLSGCISSPTLYPGTGNLDAPGIQVLGEVTACQGSMCKKDEGGYEWPMSLSALPPAYTYQSALAKKAAKQYGIPESDVVFGETKVGYYAEMIGTIRGWKADAPLGKSLKRSGSMSASSDAGTLPMASSPMRQMVSPLNWTTDRPTKPGWYWYQPPARRTSVEVQVDDHRSLYITHTGNALTGYAARGN